ncbi:ABC transporter ATP-binding protein [Dactylosporangium sp. CS-033363]|uniref:ABC transporter ATP-binding protein n=1 Tax=Dactylosporangium sp. CS-033363 TaxID=3239935 RepID=UPI003D943400
MADSTARHVARLVWKSARWITGAQVTVTVAEALAPVTMAWLTKLVLDRLAGTGPVLGLVAALAGIGVLAAALQRLGVYLRNEIDRRVGAAAIDELFAATGRFVGLARFEDPAFLDRIRLARQGSDGAGALVDGVLGLGRGVLLLAGFIGALLTISPAMTGLLLLAAVPMLLAELALSRRRASTRRRVEPNHRREYFYSQLLTGVRAAKEIRLFGTGGFLRGLMLGERATADAAQRRLEQREVGVHTVLAMLSAAVAGGGLVWAVLAARRGELSIGDVSIFVTAVASVQSGLAMVVATTAGLHGQGLLFGEFVAVLRAEPDLPVGTAPLPALRGEIRLRDVWFRYSDEHPWVLRGVDLTVPAGATVALVGLNGSGKSTLVKLLCRLYDPTRGSITWDGLDLREVDPAALRARLGAVFQDFMVYDLSAHDNIKLGNLRAGSRDHVTAAARQAGIDETLTRLPRGYDTLLTREFFGEGDDSGPEAGVVLSGGQWQRIAIARGFLRTEADLMILDEPSSGLDPEAEHEIHAALHAARRGRTNLLISHRLSTVRDADLIAVLDEGRITELGDHACLLEAGGRYADLFRLQAEGYAVA